MKKNIIKKSADGTYYFRASLGTDPKTGKRKQKYMSKFRTKREALDCYYELQLQKENKEEEETNITYKEYLETIFLPFYHNTVKQQTYDNRYAIIKKHFGYFDSYLVSKITALDVQKWVLMLSENLKPNYVRAVQGLFSLSMDRAVILGLSKENPSKVIGSIKKQKTKFSIWTKDEFEHVLSVVNKDDYYQFFLFVSIWFLFMTGLRIGEATALFWNDLDFDTGILTINKSLIYKSQKEYRFSETKTKSSNRQIVLDNDTIELLKAWKQKQALVNKTESFILSYNGFPTQKNTLSQAIKRYSKLAGIHSIRIHDLRHSHASLLIAMGTNALIVRDRLGHSDIQMTLEVYGHLYPNTNYEVAHKLNGIIKIADNSKEYSLTRNQHTSKLT